jgi:hypothetical protein
MKNTQNDITVVWKHLAVKIKGRGKVLSDEETGVSITPGKRSGEVDIVLNSGIMKVMERMVTNETKKLVAKNGGKYHLLRFLAFCGGIAFSPRKIKVPNLELFYALGFIFQQTLRCIKRGRVEEEKGAILNQAEKIVSGLLPKRRVTSVYYGSGLFNIKISGYHHLINGSDSKETISNLKKFIN